MESRPPTQAAQRIRSRFVLVSLLVAAGVLLFPVPALFLGARGMFRLPGYSPDERADRVSVALMLSLRALGWLLVLALSAVVLISTIGAAVQDVELHGLVYVFFALDVLLALCIVFSFGRRERRPGRRRASPAAR